MSTSTNQSTSASTAAEDTQAWIVLVNTHNEHSLWPACTPVPDGWREVGPEGSAERCAAWIEQHWKAMQPAGAKA